MSALDIDVNGTRVAASFEGPGYVACQLEAGALPLPGTIRGQPIPNAVWLVVHGALQPSAIRQERFEYFNQVLPHTTRVRVSSVAASGGPEQPQRAAQADQTRVRAALEHQHSRLKHFFSKRPRKQLPAPPDFQEPGQFGPAAIGLRFEGPHIGPLTAGVPSGVVVATLQLRRAAERETLSIEIRGGTLEDRTIYFWARGPLTLGDELFLSVVADAVPSPARRLPLDPHIAARYAQQLYELLERELDASRPQ